MNGQTRNNKSQNQTSKPLFTVFYLRLVLPDGQRVDLDISAQSTIVLGRQEGNERKVDVNLTAFDGYEHGVSRTHAIIRITDDKVFVEDSNSHNGTYLNGYWLYPMRSYSLQDGDELMLGSLKLQIKFL